MIICAKCGMEKEADHRNKRLCVECVKAENNRLAHIRRNHDWIAAAQEQGLDLWAQQPDETQWEYTVWLAFRDSYPGKKPTYREAAKQAGTTYEAVQHIASRWNFQTRLQAWIAECDRITLLQRRNEILDMNKDHIDMAAALRNKLKKAIDLVDPYDLKPNEIVQLTKLANEMERNARLDTIAQEEARQPLLTDTSNPNLKKVTTKKDDLKEVMTVLLEAGALGDVTHVGVRRTEATEVAVVDKDGTRASIILDE